MRNIVGQPVSGNDFYPRKAITNLIYRRLDSGSNLFMAAPRRVGKTSVMYHLRDNPRDSYSFIYVNTEPIDNSELYFRRLFEALLNSETIGGKIKASQKVKSVFEAITEKVKKIGAFGVELELEKKEREKYADIFHELMQKLESDDICIVIMIDEFPSTVENIHQKSGIAEAVQFLKQNRTIRQESAGGIQFIYTGSIGLPSIVNRLGTPESINDLNQVEVPPLNKEEGKEFASQLLRSAEVPFSPESLDYLLEKISWLMPFFIQLSVQELIDLFDQKHEGVSNKIVDEAFERICNRRNNIHFDSYYKRLEDAFSQDDYEIALNLLNKIAEGNPVPLKSLYKKSYGDKKKRQINSIIESLEYDGYINLLEDHYTFNSPILQLWWNRYIRS